MFLFRGKTAVKCIGINITNESFKITKL